MARKQGIGTRSVHQGVRSDPATRAIVPPIVQSSAFAFEDLDTWSRVVSEGAGGDIYSRNSNPTVTCFIDRVAGLEGAEAGSAFATGMAAVSTTLFALLEPGKRVVTVRDAYGATFLLFTEILPRWGVDCAVCDTTDVGTIRKEIEAGCDLVYLETPTNPTLEILDLRDLCGRARAAGAVSVVDNTLATPVNQQPLSLGADLVLHSATKFLCGLGDALGGVVCGSGELVRRLDRYRELTGPSMDAHTASLLLRSLRTLGLRVERQNETAAELAGWLGGQEAVERVFYPGLAGHPGHEIARRQMSGYGGVLSFTLKGGMEATRRTLPRLRLAWLAPNLGQVDTVAGPAYLTSHVELSAQERAASGVPDHLIRYSCGIEEAADLRADLEQALAG